MGVAVLVAAPGLIPRKPSDRVKTDRRDARSIAVALRAGQLTGIHIPTVQDESVRDYLRMYEDLRGDLRICKQRVLHFLLRRGIRYEKGGPWTVRHKNWLASLEFADARDRKTLDMYLSTMQELEGKCSEAAEEVEQIAAQERYREQTKKLCAFKGIKTLIALSFVAEIGDFRRFPNARQFMAFLGLVPSEHSSGNKRRQGGITKAGQQSSATTVSGGSLALPQLSPQQSGPHRAAPGAGSTNPHLCQSCRATPQSQVHAPPTSGQALPGCRYSGQPRAGRIPLGRDDRSGGLNQEPKRHG
jgi:transposase